MAGNEPNPVQSGRSRWRVLVNGQLELTCMDGNTVERVSFIPGNREPLRCTRGTP